ncbi:Gamma-glutamyl cyclotransferase, partial [Lachnellula suecica]
PEASRAPEIIVLNTPAFLDTMMPHQSHQPTKIEDNSETCWYFAYGSNLSPPVFTGKRGIKPLDFKVSFLPGYALCFNILFMPYSEPAMAGLKICGKDDEPVYGVQYLLSRADFLKLVASEGAGVAYRVVSAEANCLDDGTNVTVFTLIARRALFTSQQRLPSQRYMLVD